MKDWLLAVLGTVFAFVLILGAVAYQSRQEPAAEPRFTQSVPVSGPEQRLMALAQQVAHHEQCLIAGNLLPSERLEDQPLRAIFIAQNAHFSVGEREEQLLELDRAITYKQMEPGIQHAMSSPN